MLNTISSSTSHWTFEINYQGQSYLNNIGRQTLKEHSLPSEVLNPLRANCFHETLSQYIQENDIVFGPLITSNSNYIVQDTIYNKYRKWNLYKATKDEKWIIVPNTASNLKQAQENEQLEFFDLNWFQFKRANNKLYFFSKKIGNVCLISTYWTKFGESYLISRRKQYLELKKNCVKFNRKNSNELNSYKYLPGFWE